MSYCKENINPKSCVTTFIAVNCVMDRATLDAALQKDLQTEGFTLEARPEVGGHAIQLSRQQFRDLIAVHLGDWLQQVLHALILSLYVLKAWFAISSLEQQEQMHMYLWAPKTSVY